MTRASASASAVSRDKNNLSFIIARAWPRGRAFFLAIRGWGGGSAGCRRKQAGRSAGVVVGVPRAERAEWCAAEGGVKRGKRWAADNTNSQFRHSLPPPIFSLSLPVSVQPPFRRERSERAESPAKRLVVGGLRFTITLFRKTVFYCIFAI